MTKGNINVLTDKLKRFLYPPVCPLCGDVVRQDAAGVCESCSGRISYVTVPSCLKCGKEIDDEETELCADCRRSKRDYVRGFPVMNYTGPVVGSVAAFKYNNRRDLADFFANEIIRRRGREILEAAPEALVPVPVHKSRLKERGYNQAELLARRLGERLDVPVSADILARTVNTVPQKKLDNAEREKNLKKAFISDAEIVQYKRVMLVDDIYTTGATIQACTEALMKKGIAEVYYTSICIGRGY